MDIREKIVAIIVDTLKVPPERVIDDAKLSGLARDSIALFELLIQFENALGRHVVYEDIAAIETVGDIIRYAQTLPADVLAAILAEPHSPSTTI